MNSLIPLPKCAVTLTGATFDPSITFEEWADVLKRAVKVKEAIQWVVGDGINYGHARWVEQSEASEKTVMRRKYEVALEMLPYEYGTLRIYSFVCAHVDPLIRINTLSFRHHQCVASLEGKQQKKYLALAAKNDLSVADLNELIRSNEAEVKPSSEPSEIKPGPLEWATRLSLWAKQQTPDVERWALERVKVVEADIRAVAELHRKLQERLATVERPVRGVRLTP